MKQGLLISFLLHAILFLGLLMGLPPICVDRGFQAYKVYLVTPSHKNWDRTDAPEKEQPEKEQPEKEQSEKEQPEDGQNAYLEEEVDTISLDTHDIRYVAYATVIRERIQKNWEYPSKAQEKGVEGRLALLFSLERDGTLTRVVIRRGSGHDILDKEATRAIFASAPFPPFPAGIIALRLNIRAAFDYRLR